MNNSDMVMNFKIILFLEWLGIRIEDTKDELNSHGIPTKTVYYFSVPESSTIEISDEEFNGEIKTSDGLKLVAKEVITDMIIDSCKAVYPDDDEFIEDVKNNIPDYIKFYAKVRKGETWNKELGDNRVKELTEEVRKASGYKEV